MSKTATLICIGIGLCLMASGALAGTNAQSGGTVMLASNSGLWVRVASAETDWNGHAGNVCGSAVNTGGITRATTAVKIDGRVFLTGGRSMLDRQMNLAAVTRHAIDAKPARKSPQGLGGLLARIFGLG